MIDDKEIQAELKRRQKYIDDDPNMKGYRVVAHVGKDIVVYDLIKDDENEHHTQDV